MASKIYIGNIIPSFFQKVPHFKISKKTLIKTVVLAPLIFFVGKQIYDWATFDNTFLENSQIKHIDCKIDSLENAAKSNKATDLYCYAQKLIDTKIDENIIKARSLLKDAYDKGLNLSNLLLCKEHMFPDKNTNESLSSKFSYICCPKPPEGCLCYPEKCPWWDTDILRPMNNWKLF